MADKYVDAMLQRIARKSVYTMADMYKALNKLGFEVSETSPIDPYDKRLDIRDHNGDPVDLRKAWRREDGSPNERIVIAPGNTPALDSYEEIVRPDAMKRAITRVLRPRSEGGGGGVFSYSHGEKVSNGEVLGYSTALEDEGIYLLAFGFQADTPTSDIIWDIVLDTQRKGVPMGFSIGMDPDSIEREEHGPITVLTDFILDEISATPHPANGISRAVGINLAVKSVPDDVVKRWKGTGVDDETARKMAAKEIIVTRLANTIPAVAAAIGRQVSSGKPLSAILTDTYNLMEEESLAKKDEENGGEYATKEELAALSSQVESISAVQTKMMETLEVTTKSVNEIAKSLTGDQDKEEGTETAEGGEDGGEEATESDDETEDEETEEKQDEEDEEEDEDEEEEMEKDEGEDRSKSISALEKRMARLEKLAADTGSRLPKPATKSGGLGGLAFLKQVDDGLRKHGMKWDPEVA